jgi:quercetin dioxygenase-like cupin family protein
MKSAAIDSAALPLESWSDPARGTIRWRTLLPAALSSSAGLVAGVAELAAGDDYAAHHHPETEIYFGLEGEGTVMIDGTPNRLAPGIILYIAGGAVHAIPSVARPLRFLYAFAARDFDDIRYTFV